MNFDTPSIARLWLGPLLPSPGTPLPGSGSPLPSPGIPIPSPGSPAASAATSIRNKSYELLFLSPYLPNLDITERSWKFTKKCVLYGRYHDKPEKFHQAIKDSIREVNCKHQNEQESLLALNFQILNSENAHFDAA